MKFNTNSQGIALQILLSHIIAQSKMTGNPASALSMNTWLPLLSFTNSRLLYISLQSAGTASLVNSEFLKNDETFC